MTPELQAQAERLWPGDPDKQAKWMKAVLTVRKTSGGWLIDHKVPKVPAPAFLRSGGTR